MSKDTLQVFATRDGWYDGYKKPDGVPFTIRDPNTSFAKTWMVPVDDEAGKAFVSRLVKQRKASNDAITGERLQSGGAAEQLSQVMRELAETKAEMAALKAAASAPQAEAKAPKPAAAEQAVEQAPADDGANDTTEDQPARRRRAAS